MGIGGVGRSLIEQIVAQRPYHAENYGLDLCIQTICDSSGVLSSKNGVVGIDDTTLREVLALKDSGKGLVQHPDGVALSQLADIVDQSDGNGAILVDCTASESTSTLLLNALKRQFKIVLANKIPLTVQQEVYDRLTKAGATQGPIRLDRCRWETTVGAGLPAIATLSRLMTSGDEINRIAGTFSGTLGYVMTGLQEGKLLSQIVREAYDLGYTEPDPRDDLGGVDVARKALILARGMGWELELSDVQVEGLYPPHMDSLSIDEFLDSLPELDAAFQQRISSANANGQVLRFAATVENHACRVMPTLVAVESPLGRLSGTDNLVEFTTRWYSPNPLVIQGRGAGVEATAAGVLSDIIELAFV